MAPLHLSPAWLVEDLQFTEVTSINGWHTLRA